METTADLGNKHECPNCAVKYYDLGKSDPHCPKCGASVTGELPDEDEATDAEPEKKTTAKKTKKKTTKKKTSKKKTTKKKPTKKKTSKK